MTQRIFDIENEQDMQDLWSILPDEAEAIRLNKLSNTQTYHIKRNGKIDFDTGYLIKLLKIEWHNENLITKTKKATVDDIGKICVFWNTDMKNFYSRLEHIDKHGFYSQDGEFWENCRRLNPLEIEELC